MTTGHCSYCLGSWCSRDPCRAPTQVLYPPGGLCALFLSCCFFFGWRYLTIVRPWRRAMDRILLRGLVVVVVPPLVGMAMDVVFGLLYYTARTNTPARVVIGKRISTWYHLCRCRCRRRRRGRMRRYRGFGVLSSSLFLFWIQSCSCWLWQRYDPNCLVFKHARARNCVLTSCTCLRVSAISRRHA